MFCNGLKRAIFRNQSHFILNNKIISKNRKNMVFEKKKSEYETGQKANQTNDIYEWS